jgi:hydroxypyruvate isomerase
MYQLAASAETLFLDRPFAERARTLASHGFLVEIWDWSTKDLEELAATGAEIVGMSGHLRGSIIDAEEAVDYLAGAVESIVAAERLGCRQLVLHTTEVGPDGRVLAPIETITGPMWITAYQTLMELAELAERHDVTYVLENLNTRVDHAGAPLSRATDVLDLVEAVDSPRVLALLDLYHAQIDEGNLIELVRRAGPRLGEIQVADVPGRHEPGTGEINYPRVAAELREIGYEGVVGLEAFPAGDDEIALDRFREAFASP